MRIFNRKTVKCKTAKCKSTSEMRIFLVKSEK